ncbi:MAG TPA: hypothetical protein VNE21_03265 [Mycobacteriales bacterium]|nr:hypothetical protein [Mycobacteriales bacterium]
MLARGTLTRGRLARAGAWAALGVLGALLAGSVAYADVGGSTSAAATTNRAGGTGARPGTSGAHSRARLAGPLRRTLHGQFVVRSKGGYETLDLQRGILTTASSTAVTVRSPDGFTRTYALTGATRIRERGQTEPVSALAAGDRVTVVAVETPTGPVARLVMSMHRTNPATRGTGASTAPPNTGSSTT